MRYMLMDYVNEDGWPQLSNDEQRHWLGAYKAYLEAMAQAGVLEGEQRLADDGSRNHRARRRRQDAGAGRPLCRLEGAARRFPHHRRGRSRCRDRLGARSPTALHGVVEVRPVRDGSLLTDDVADFIDPA